MKKFLIVIIFCFLFISCSHKEEKEIVFDSNYTKNLSPDISWALITEPYVAFKENKSWNSTVMGHCRKGDIYQIIGKSVDETNSVWYYFDKGWLPQSSLSVYTNRYKAESASAVLIKK